MQLTPHIFVRIGRNNDSIILETKEGADELDLMELTDLIISLRRINMQINPLAGLDSTIIEPNKEENDTESSLSLKDTLKGIKCINCGNPLILGVSIESDTIGEDLKEILSHFKCTSCSHFICQDCYSQMARIGEVKCPRCGKRY